MLKFSITFLASILALAVASDVLDLTDSDFNQIVKEHDVMLVEFFAPWCGHCKRLAPEYEKAATSLKKNDPSVALAKVDCVGEGKDTCSANGVSGYPTLKIFKNGKVFEDYNGPRDASGIVKHMKGKVGPASVQIKSVADMTAKLNKNNVMLVAFYSDDSKIKEFEKACDSIRETISCAHTSSEEVIKKFGENDSVFLFRPRNMKNKFEDSEVKYDGDLKGSSLTEFVNKNINGLCGHRTQDNAAKFGANLPLVIAYYDVNYELNPKGTNYWRNRVMKVLKKFSGKLEGCVSNAADFNYEKEEMGLKGTTKSPQIGIRDTNNKKYPMMEEFSMEKFEDFLEDYLAGKLTPYLKSEPIPESNDGPVKVAVGSNFEEVVENVDKDVLVEFYAPWCGHCKKLAPTLEELGEKMAGEDVSIVKMDATANDVPSKFDVTGFPTLYWVPKNDKNSPKRYEGGREVDDFVKYIAKEATDELKGFNRKGKAKKVEL